MGEHENGYPSCNNTITSTASSQPQLPPEPQQSSDRTSSAPSNRRFENTTSTTDPSYSGTSAAAETSLPNVSGDSDQQGQQQALTFHDCRLQPHDDTPIGSEADPTDPLTEVEEVTPDRGPTTGGVRIIITGDNFPLVQLYVRFGDWVTRAVGRGLS